MFVQGFLCALYFCISNVFLPESKVLPLSVYLEKANIFYFLKTCVLWFILFYRHEVCFLAKSICYTIFILCKEFHHGSAVSKGIPGNKFQVISIVQSSSLPNTVFHLQEVLERQKFYPVQSCQKLECLGYKAGALESSSLNDLLKHIYYDFVLVNIFWMSKPCFVLSSTTVNNSVLFLNFALTEREQVF